VRDVQIPEPDLEPILDRIARIETRLASGPSTDVLIGSLAGIESDLDVLSRRTVDFEPVYTQLSALESSFNSVRTELRGSARLEGLERRIASLQQSISELPQPNYERIDLAIRDIESRFNLGALEDRLTSIEYGLTAVHHMLRSRGETVRTEVDPRPVPPPRATRVVAPAQAETVSRVVRRSDPIARARRPDDEANLLTHAAFGAGDDLEQIVGVGPMLAGLLREIGVYYFWQVAEWTDEDVAYVDGKLLHFKGRIERDDWVGQSRELAALPSSAKRPATD
jgi:predicted flap endonuclease-1-like 5' DNA nuclease